MKTILKAGLLASVSVAALGLTIATPAHAFDEVNWTWDAAITETITKNVNININIDPTGMTMVENLQGHIGDVTATSKVQNIYNNQPAGTGTVDLGSTDIQFHYGIGGAMIPGDPYNSPNVSAGNVDEVDQMPNINGTVTATVDLGEVTVPATASLDAVTQLPSIVSAATAVSNNLNITTDVALQLHSGQFLVGEGSGEGSDPAYYGTGNSSLTIAAALASMALNGDLVKSEVKAKSTVSDILNATVDSSATAVGNNLSVSVAPVSAGNALLIGDVTQFAFADVTAKSKVNDVTISNYTGLGSLARPVVNSVATAVGNNASITVKTPVVAAP
ncbi:hypothetical protein [Ferrovibrio terrae]|uniref:hypothetical protein n=1 Tax=Ferrovibrio terrae TaxID=2594003 RepID=UPI003137BC9D